MTDSHSGGERLDRRGDPVRVRRPLQQHRLALQRPQPQHVEHLLRAEPGGLGGARRPAVLADHLALEPVAVGARPLGEAVQLGEALAARVAEHDAPGSLPRSDQALGHQDGDRLPHGPPGRAVPFGQLGLGGELRADRVDTGEDLVAQLIGYPFIARNHLRPSQFTKEQCICDLLGLACLYKFP